MTCRRIVRQLSRFAPAVFAISLAIAPAFAADDSNETWKALVEGGHVALIRHGNAPGPSLGAGGDPPGFRIGDCRTQRNLDETGRGEAKALGEAFRRHGVRVDRVQSSPWCRCMETAQLMAVGPVETSSALVPSTDRNPTAAEALLSLKETISTWRGPGTLVLITHGFTVRALTGIVPGQAETVVLKPTPGIGSRALVVGRIAAPR
jgi:phosphohistidine phosphatase SixA